MDLMHSAQLWTQRRIRFVITCGLLVVLALAFSACGGASQPDAAEPVPATEEPAVEPAAEPTAEAAEEPTVEPAEEPTAEAAEEPTAEPVEEPTAEPMEESAMAGDPENGAYIATLAGGCGCHFNRDIGALAGGNKFEGAFGVVYAPNLTPDPDTGLGSLSVLEIAHILQTGMRPDGSQLAPAMPYRAYSVLSDKEALDVAAYLHSLEPVANEIPPSELTGEIEAWMPASQPPAEPVTEPVARGEVLVTVARCGSCHTPSNEDGTPNMDLYLAGAPVREEIASNITPDEATGIGAWSAEEIAALMLTGTRPDGSQVEGAMAQQIERRFSQLTEDDAAAIGAYLKTIPAVENDPYAE